MSLFFLGWYRCGPTNNYKWDEIIPVTEIIYYICHENPTKITVSWAITVESPLVQRWNLRDPRAGSSLIEGQQAIGGWWAFEHRWKARYKQDS